MEINVLEKKKNRLVFELPGADHTFCNSLKNELWLVSDIKVATYAIKHPLLAVPKFIVETKKGDPVAALKSASTNVQKRMKGIKAAFDKL
jgi:DNA-directed RNA polymerase subunit L